MSNVIPINSDKTQRELEKLSELIVRSCGCFNRLVELDDICSNDDMANMNLSVLDMISFLEMYRSEKYG